MQFVHFRLKRFCQECLKFSDDSNEHYRRCWSSVVALNAARIPMLWQWLKQPLFLRHLPARCKPFRFGLWRLKNIFRFELVPTWYKWVWSVRRQSRRPKWSLAYVQPQRCIAFSTILLRVQLLNLSESPVLATQRCDAKQRAFVARSCRKLLRARR